MGTTLIQKSILILHFLNVKHMILLKSFAFDDIYFAVLYFGIFCCNHQKCQIQIPAKYKCLQLAGMTMAGEGLIAVYSRVKFISTCTCL